jgi:replication factor C large subunit
MNWAEKYRPRKIKDIAGNPKALKDLEEWANSWSRGKPKKKAAVLIGEAGVGKTSAALALANDFGWGLVEMNASDKRNAKAIRKVAFMGAISETFTDEGDYITREEGGRKLIILDEADNLFGREDSGGIGAIVDTIRKAEQPIILIVNDYYGLTRRSSSIKKLVKEIKFSRLDSRSVKSVLRTICRLEDVKVSDSILDFLAKNAKGDLRSAVNDLEALAHGKTEIRDDDLKSIGYRDPRSRTFDVLREIFKGTDCAKPRRALWALDETPETLMLWIDENLPSEYRRSDDLAAGYNALSRADIFLGRVSRRQYFGFWSYASDMMTAGVAMAKKEPYPGFTPYRFPLWLVKMSRSKTIRGTTTSISRKLMQNYHISIDNALTDLLPYFKHLYLKDEDFRIYQTIKLDLSEREIAHILGKKEDSPDVLKLASLKKKEKEEKHVEIFQDRTK